MKTQIYFIIVFVALCFGCSSQSLTTQNEDVIAETTPEDIVPEQIEEEIEENQESLDTLKILALGDSYTIGQSVCETCRFPEQLKSRLLPQLDSNIRIKLEIIARTGWTTTNLIQAINDNNPDNNFDLATLLIGVNNEFRQKPFSIYQAEFPQLVNTAITKVNGNKNKVIVISIPDYAFTPYGKGNTNISNRLNDYNNFAENYCSQNNISFVNITDITRQGLTTPELVAQDGLHPSRLAYSKFVDRLLPIAIEKLTADQE